MKKLCKAAAVFLLCAGVLAGCGSKEDTKAEKKMPVVSVARAVEHEPLNTIRDSFKAETEALGCKSGENTRLDFRNVDGQQNMLNSITPTSTGNKSGVIVAITTPAAVAAAKYSKNIPIIFSAVSDPVGTGLMDDLKKPDNNITGTGDEIQVDQILDLALEVDPNLKTLGSIYDSSEANSVSNLAKAKEFCREYDIKLVEGSGANITEVQSTVGALIDKCDVIFAPNDSTMTSSMSALVETADKRRIPVYTGADSMVDDDGFATVGINCTELGKETAGTMGKTPKGGDVEDLPVKVFKDNLSIYVNEKTMETLGIQPPKGVENSKNLIII